MEINVRDDSKMVEVWLTREEKQDQALRERLKPLYRECKAQKYLVAVFLSGTEDLAEQTSALLCYNRRRCAELEVRRERERGMQRSM